MAIDAADRFESNSAEVASSLLDDELVLINLSTGVYYSATNSCSLIWQLTDLGFSPAEIVATVAARYRVPPDQVANDVHALLEQLLAERIVVPATQARTRGELPPSETQAAPYDRPVLHVYRDMGDLLALDAPMPDMKDVPWKGGAGGN